MFRPFIWAIFRLRFLTYRLVIQDVGHLGGRGRDARCFSNGYHDPELLEVNFLVLFMYTFYAKSML